MLSIEVLLPLALFLLYFVTAQKLWKSKMALGVKIILEIVLLMVAGIVIGYSKYII